VSQYILGILKALSHLGVIRFESMTQWQSLPLALFVDVGHEAALGIEQNLGVVLEINLNDLVGEAEHDRVLSTHPLLYVDVRVYLELTLGLAVLTNIGSGKMLLILYTTVVITSPVFMIFEVRPKVLHECHFLVKLFWIIIHIMDLHDILFLSGRDRFSFIVIES